MSRIIVNNKSKATDKVALRIVGKVMEMGLISGVGDKKQYCHATQFNTGYVVCARKTKTGHAFDVVDEKEKEA